MQIGVGYKLTYNLPQSTPMLLTVNIHYSRTSDLVMPDHLVTVPAVPVTGYRDLFGNWISRMSPRLGRSVCQDTPLLGTSANPIRFAPVQSSTPCRHCRKKPWCSCSAAGTARRTASRKSPGTCLLEVLLGGDASRRSATTFIIT